MTKACEKCELTPMMGRYSKLLNLRFKFLIKQHILSISHKLLYFLVFQFKYSLIHLFQPVNIYTDGLSHNRNLSLQKGMDE